MELIEAIASCGNYSDGIWTIGDLDADTPVSLVLITKAAIVGNITNVAIVNSSTPDKNTTNNVANNTTTVNNPVVDLEVRKNSDRNVYYVNDTMCWIIEVINHGPCVATEVVAYDVLSDDVEFISCESSKGLYNESSGEWIIGDLAKGEKATLFIYCKVLKEGFITNFVNVTCGVNETNLDNNYANCTVEVTNKTEPAPGPEPTPDEPVKQVMRSTGNPLAYIAIAILIILGSFWSNRKE